MLVVVEFIISYKNGLLQDVLHLGIEEKVSEEEFITKVLESLDKERIKQVIKISATRLRTPEEQIEIDINLRKFITKSVTMADFNNNLLNPEDRFPDIESVYNCIKIDKQNMLPIMNLMLATSGKYKYFSFLLARKGKYYLDSTINPNDEDVKKWENLKNTYYESLGSNHQSANTRLKSLHQSKGTCTSCEQSYDGTLSHDHLQIDFKNELSVKFQFK